jgi:hypothetical protein
MEARRRSENRSVSSLDPLLEFVLPFAIVGVLVLLLRWTWGRGSSLAPRTPHRGSPAEYGLLVPVAAPEDDADALRLAGLLDAAGVRNTLVGTTRGPRLMVWEEDVPRARRLLRDEPRKP